MHLSEARDFRYLNFQKKKKKRMLLQYPLPAKMKRTGQRSKLQVKVQPL